MEYFSKGAQAWLATTIEEVTASGFSVTCKKGLFHPFQNPELVRRPNGPESASAAGSAANAPSADGSDVVHAPPTGVRSDRPRGETDPWWSHKVQEALKLHKGVTGILAHFTEKYPDGDPRVALGRMLCSAFPPPGTLRTSVSVDISRGPCHPSSFSFSPCAWDLFFVYESDFLREVMAIVVDGLPQPGLLVQPMGKSGDGFFAWKPDGEYRVFVRIAAVLFIAITTVENSAENPAWLVSDLSELPATCSSHANAVRRGMAALKSTILASKQNRAADPLMIDHMLTDMCVESAVGSGDGNKTTPDNFINKYNASVGYDKSLMLRDNASRRQQNLRDASKCTLEMKALMRAATEESESFEATGLSLEIMAASEFWVGAKFIGSTHPMWVQYGRTSEQSCIRALKILFASAKKGNSLTSGKFKALARRLGFAVAIARGVFVRRSVSEAICEDMIARVEEGLYDDDIDNQITDCDEGAPQTNDLAMDQHLAEVSQFVQDGLELQETARSSNPEAEARLEKASAMGDEEWFLAEVEHETAAFLKARGNRVKLAEALQSKKDAWNARVETNVKEATASFAEYHAPHIKLDLDSPAEFEKALQARKEFVARERRVDVKKLLAVYCMDLSVLGGVTDEALKLCNMALRLLHPKDILMVIGHGAPVKGTALQKHQAASAGGSGATLQAVPGLPMAPSDIGVAINKAAVRAQLVAEFDKIVDKLKGVPRTIAWMFLSQGWGGWDGMRFRGLLISPLLGGRCSGAFAPKFGVCRGALAGLHGVCIWMGTNVRTWGQSPSRPRVLGLIFEDLLADPSVR